MPNFHNCDVKVSRLSLQVFFSFTTYDIHFLQVNNILIVNLAVSDMLLCTVVLPKTFFETLYKPGRIWVWPKIPIFCQLSGMVTGLLAFVSTLTIVGIAIDR